MNIKRFFEECINKENINISNIIISVEGKNIFEYCEPPYRWDAKQLLFSMTKSFSALAIGIACDKGIINKSDKVVDFFEEEKNKVRNDNLGEATIVNALTMSMGVEEDDYFEIKNSSNWTKRYFEQYFALLPGTSYRYDTFTSHILSAIITQATSMSMEDFLNKYLFFPMGIYEAQWENAPEGITAGGMGLSLFPSSVMKIANLLINKGIYEGKRLISEEYIDLATSKQITKQNEKGNNKIYSGYEYGYQFHIDKNKCYRMDGAFGQICLINQKQKLAVTVFSHNSKTEELLKLVDRYLINDIYPLCSIPKGALTPKLPFRYLFMSDFKINYDKRRYKINKNDLKISEIVFKVSNSSLNIFFVYDSQDIDEYRVRENEFYYGYAKFINDIEIKKQKYACIGRIYRNLIELIVYYIETPYIVSYYFEMIDNQMNFYFDINNSFTLNKFHVLGNIIE